MPQELIKQYHWSPHSAGDTRVMHTEQPEAEPETMTHNDVVPGTSLAMLQSSSEIDR